MIRVRTRNVFDFLYAFYMENGQCHYWMVRGISERGRFSYDTEAGSVADQLSNIWKRGKELVIDYA